MKNLVEIKFGSHLYGTATPQSDLDLKRVHIPCADDILLGRGKEIHNTTTKNGTVKNSADDIDIESLSLKKYLALAAEGQTVALDMLFAPAFALTGPPDELWEEIQANRSRLLSSRYMSFLGYCRTQANKYGIKGSRMAAARAIVELLTARLEQHGTTAKLSVIDADLREFVGSHEHSTLVELDSPGDKRIPHLDICGRKAPYTSSIKNAHAIYKALFDEYGQRSLAAERNEGIDWKALSHAVRVGRQAMELLTTGFVTFPRPDASHLLAVKTGKLSYREVSAEIEALLIDVESTAANSVLPAAPDYEWIDRFVLRVYRQEIVG